MKTVYMKIQGIHTTFWYYVDGRKVFLNRTQFDQMLREGAGLMKYDVK